MSRYTTVAATLLTTTLVACAGCGSVKTGGGKLAKILDVRRAMWWKEQKPDPQAPVRLVSSWTDTVLHRPGQKSQRGFGGRLSFFGRESEEPVRVDGQLVVYAYDEGKGDPSNTQPTRRFIFPRDQFERLESESTLGPSYSLWLPWDDEVAGPRKNISLIVRFEPHDGPLLVGEQTRHLLPGTALPGTALAGETPAAESGASGIQLAQHTSAPPAGLWVNDASLDGATTLRPEMTTQSIQLSQHWRERFATPSTVSSFRERYSTATTEPTEIPRPLFPRNSTHDSPQSVRPSTGFPPATHPAAAQSSFR